MVGAHRKMRYWKSSPCANLKERRENSWTPPGRQLVRASGPPLAGRHAGLLGRSASPARKRGAAGQAASSRSRDSAAGIAVVLRDGQSAGASGGAARAGVLCLIGRIEGHAFGRNSPRQV